MKAARLDFFLLGPPGIVIDGKPLALPRRKTAALLYYLASRPEPLGRSAAAGLLWPEFPPDRARQSLRQALFDVRRLAGRSLVEADDRYLGFSNDLEMTNDALRFATLAERGLALSAAPSTGDPEGGRESASREALLEAELLYRGEFLEGFFLDDAVAFEEWQLAEAERLTSLAASVETGLARLALRAGEPREAEAKARRAIEVAPWFELGHCLVVEALAAAGDPGAARAHARAYATALLRECERKPGPVFNALLERLDRDFSGPSGSRRAETASPARAFAPSLPLGTRLPAVSTSILGREAELASIEDALRPGAILTIVGTGGIGKTRLAIEAASRLESRFTDGARFVDLVPCVRGPEVFQTLAATLGLRRSGAGNAEIPAFLAGRDLLLVLDNCEHVAEGAAELASLIVSACPTVAILATSRERLALPQERVLELSGLDRPSPAEASLHPEVALEKAALRLFVERAAATSPGFVAGPGEAADLAAICGRLDGLPLAIELAASRAAGLGPRALRERLESRITAPLDLLEGCSRSPRAAHRTLAALFEWSWETLDEEEKLVLERLSVFRGDFSLEAAMAVSGTATELPVLRLRDKSLVVSIIDPEGEARYRLLETVKAWVSGRLADAGSEEEARRRHVAWYAAEAGRAEAALHDLREPAVIRRLAGDIEEFEGAVRYAISMPDLVGTAASMLRALAELFRRRGAMQRYARLLAELRPRVSRSDAGLGAADLAYASAWIGFWNFAKDFSADFEKAAAIYARIGDKERAAWSLAYADLYRDDWERGPRKPENSLRAETLFEELGRVEGRIAALIIQAWIEFADNDRLEAARTILDRAFALARSSGNRIQEGACHWLAASLCRHRHETGPAREHLEAYLGACELLDDADDLGDALYMLAVLEYEEGEVEAGLATALRCVEYRRRGGHPIPIANSQRLAAMGLDMLGREAEAIALVEAALAGLPTEVNPRERNLYIYSLAHLELRRGDRARSRRIIDDLIATVGDSDGDPLPRLLVRYSLARFEICWEEPVAAANHFRGIIEELAKLPEAKQDLSAASNVHLGILEPASLDVDSLLRCLPAALSSFDPGAIEAAIALGLRLVHEQETGFGLDLAAAGIARRQVSIPVFFYQPERRLAELAIENLRRRLGDLRVDGAVDKARARYAADKGLFFAEFEALLPPLRALAEAGKQEAPIAFYIPATTPRFVPGPAVAKPLRSRVAPPGPTRLSARAKRHAKGGDLPA